MSPGKAKIDIRRHLATEDETLNEAFTAGLVAAYRGFGCEVAARTEAIHGMETYLLVARDSDTEEMVGGGRVYVPWETEVLLPIERTLLALGRCPAGGRLWDDRRWTGEFGALWVSDAARGRDLSMEVIRQAFRLALDLRMERLVTLSSPHVMARLRGIGFELDERFGHRGLFPYPDERYSSGVMVMHEPRAAAARLGPEFQVA